MTEQPSAASPRRPARRRRLVAVTDDDRSAAAELIAAARVASDAPPDDACDPLPDDACDPPPDGSLEQSLASLLAFLRRRLTGDFTVDEFGFDAELTDTVLLALLRPLYRTWFRVEVRGIENIPADGRRARRRQPLRARSRWTR